MFTYETILSDPKIKDIYTDIDNMTRADDNTRHWVFHGLIHIQNTIEIAKQMMPVLGIKADVQDAVLIALTLHDVGKEYDNTAKGTAGKKPNHAYNSFLLAAEYLKDKDVKYKDEILQAIKNHSESQKNGSLIDALVFSCDKLDVTGKRIGDFGKTIKGIRQWGHIHGHKFEIKNGKLVVAFLCDKDFDRAEWNAFFLKYPKWLNDHDNLTEILGLKSEIRFIKVGEKIK